MQVIVAFLKASFCRRDVLGDIMLRNFLLPIGILAGLFSVSLPANAYEYPTPTALELQILPPYCRDTPVISKQLGHEQARYGKHDAETQGYVEMYGDHFWNFHHYCFGYLHWNRAYMAKNSNQKNDLLNMAIKEFDVVLDGIEPIDPRYFLLPEMHTNKGRVYLLLKEEAAAIAEFKKAISLKADYAPAYIFLSDYYEDKNKKELALQTLEEGLTNKPDAKSLLRRYKRLGGRKVFVVTAPEETKSELKEKDTAETKETPIQVDDKPETQQNTASEPSKSGANKDNPYCRFCP